MVSKVELSKFLLFSHLYLVLYYDLCIKKHIYSKKNPREKFSKKTLIVFIGLIQNYVLF